MIDKEGAGDVLNFELFFELSPDLLCIAGYDGYFKRINPAVSNLLGYTNDELLSKPIHEFIYTDDRKLTAGHRSSLINGSPLLNFENRYITKAGEIIWLSWTSMPVDSEKIVYAIAKNITHKKKLEDERNQLISNLTKLNEELKLLTYTTSHDLRSPVNNLISVFNFIDISKIRDEETLNFILILKTAAENLKTTLNTYIDVLKRNDSLDIHTETLSFNDSLNAVLGSLSSLIRNTNTVINADFSDLEEIVFNRSYLESIFLNLITNSIKYARPGSRPRIHIYSRNLNGVKQLIFEDEGQGFEMDRVKDKIFGLHQKFHDTEDSKGIGLYLVHSYITSLGGQIKVESRVNEGARFTLSFKD